MLIFTYGDDYSSSASISLIMSQLESIPIEVLFDARYDENNQNIIASVGVDLVDPYYAYSQYSTSDGYTNKALYDSNSYDSFTINKEIYSGHNVIQIYNGAAIPFGKEIKQGNTNFLNDVIIGKNKPVTLAVRALFNHE